MPNPNLAFSAALAAGLADLGVEHVCISPGSRNTPLIAAFAGEKRIKIWPILDERTAGFFGLGLAKVTGRPVALVCTSGTAAVEFHPAVVEASQSDVPLLLLTADRPPELRNVGAPQTIDQISLYGSSPRLFIDVAVPEEDAIPDAGELARKAWLAATHPRPGPVHVNLPFREPLLNGAAVGKPEPVEHPPPTEVPPLDLTDLAEKASRRKGIIVAGRSNDAGFPAACTSLAAATGYPIIADPLSGLRFGTHSLEHVLGNGDTIAAAGALDLLAPDVVLRFGPVPTSKPTWQWLEKHPDVEQILIGTTDATHSATTILTSDPTAIARALAAAVPGAASPNWTQTWIDLDRAAGDALQRILDTAPFPNEPAVARTVVAAAPLGASLTAGSSMPIRDIDSFGGKASLPIRLLGNRGANGIDGVVSAALGTAATGIPALVLVGDVSMFHDLNALGTAVQLDLPITIIVVHNDGGGIFHFLEHRDPEIMDPAAFETYLATPHGTDFGAVATALGLESHDVSDAVELARLIAVPASGPRLIQIRTDRHANLELHRRIGAAVNAVTAAHAG